MKNKNSNNNKCNKSLSYYCGIVINRLRRENNLTGKDFARMLNISQQQVSRYERGISNYTVDMLMLMAIVLNEPFENIIKDAMYEIKCFPLENDMDLSQLSILIKNFHFY